MVDSTGCPVMCTSTTTEKEDTASEPYTPQSIHDGSSEAATASDLESQLRGLPRQRWPTFLYQEISTDIFLEIELLLLAFATGILDATTFAVYSVFVSKQTGNTISIALSALESQAVAQTEQNVAISLAMFFAGAAAFGQLGNLLGPKRRLWLLLTNTIQTALVYAATALRFWGSGDSRGPFALGVIALLSFASGGQISLALCVRVPELNTTMITGALVQLAVDDKLFQKINPARNRRAAFYLSMLVGGLVGAVVGRFASATLGLLLVAVLKSVVTVMFLFNSSEQKGVKEYMTKSPEIVQVLFGD